jgi:TusA-related sulfurtransferase
MNEHMRVKRGEELEVLTGDRLKAYNDIEKGLSITQCKICKATTKGLLFKKKRGDLRRLYARSEIKSSQKKYKAWLGELEKLENELIRWDLVIEKKKEEEDERHKKAQEK